MRNHIGVNGFEWTFVVTENGEEVSREVSRNLIPADGMAFLVRSPFGDVAPINTFYLGLFRGDYIPTSATKATDIPGNMIEFVDYEEAQRPLWDRAFDGGATMDNEDSKSVFTATQDRLIRGAFLCSDPTKGGNSGLVLSCVRFATPKQLSPGQKGELYGGLTYISTNVI